MSIANETICKNFLKQLRSYSDANWTKQQEYICDTIVQAANQRGKQYSNESEVDFKNKLKRSLNVFRDKAKLFSNGSRVEYWRYTWKGKAIYRAFAADSPEYHSRISAQSICQELRILAYASRSIDLDQVDAQRRIMLSEYDKLRASTNVPIFRESVVKRHEKLKQLMEVHGVLRSAAKDLMIVPIFGSNKRTAFQIYKFWLQSNGKSIENPDVLAWYTSYVAEVRPNLRVS